MCYSRLFIKQESTLVLIPRPIKKKKNYIHFEKLNFLKYPYSSDKDVQLYYYIAASINLTVMNWKW